MPVDYNEVDVDMVRESREERVKRLSVDWRKEEKESEEPSGALRYSEQEEWENE